MSVLPVGFGSALGGYQIERSLRFNSADSAYLNRTFGTATGTTKGTWSGWVKRGTLGTQQHIFSSSNYEFFEFQSTDKIRISNIDGNAYWITTQVFRDPSAWYHFVISWDSTLATATDRCKFWVNGVRVTQWDSQPTITQNTTFARWNVSGYGGSIGRFDFGGTWFLSAYQTEIYWIDGQALTPSSFGETDSNTGVWKPKAFSGTYGTNGFYLKFADNSGTTSTTLGKDSSGNGNNWTPNNFSVTAGVGNDSLVDTPTSYGTDTGAGGEVRGNYCVWNPINIQTSTTISEANLKFLCSAGASYNTCTGTISVSSGKWYWELTYTGASGDGSQTGILASTRNLAGLTTSAATGTWSDGYAYSDNGNKVNNGSGSAYGSTYTTGDVIGVALDLDAGTLVFYKNNTSQGTAYSSLSGSFVPSAGSFNSDYYQANFGQRPFAYTAPSGFKALCTQNLPTPTIGATSTTQANDYMNVVTFNGNGGSNAITGVGFQPDFVWVKSRSNAYSHNLHDVLRGPSSYLVSNSTVAENTSYTNICQFASDGFTLSADNSANVAGTTNVGWAWDAGGTGVSNTAGTITSTVSANTTSGFSIVTYTGTGANATVGHGLGVAPSMIIAKLRSSTSNWPVYHRSLDAGKVVWLDLTDGQTTSVSYNGAPTSSIINLGTAGGTNTSSGTHVIYAFAPVAGYSAFGSYTGNGSTDGPFAYLGFRARWILIKSTGGSLESWMLYDTTRNTYNVSINFLRAESSGAELSTRSIDINSNGFKVRDSDTKLNTNAETYIYAAFAETPFRYSLAR